VSARSLRRFVFSRAPHDKTLRIGGDRDRPETRIALSERKETRALSKREKNPMLSNTIDDAGSFSFPPNRLPESDSNERKM
jgi:hypothetical protein